MKVLVVNCGSSSLKYQLIDTLKNETCAKGNIERIGLTKPIVKTSIGDVKDKFTIEDKIITHEEAVSIMLEELIKHKAIDDLNSIDAIGHRVVHGGNYNTHIKITDEVIEQIEYLSKFAPLHNPVSARVMRFIMKQIPDKTQVAVFDTAFHQTMKDTEYTYAIPKEFSTECRRYGAHGINHEYIAQRMANNYGKKNQKMIVCHLGNGSSLCAVNESGKSVDTTMGLGPLGGLIMGTRSGDLDPTVFKFIADEGKLSTQEVFDLLNNKSGMLALSGISSDFRTIEEAAINGNNIAQLSLNIYSKMVAKFICQMEVTLEGCNTYVFTAGIGEKSPIVRKKICDYLSFKGVKIDEELNQEAFSKEMKISTCDSSVEVYVIPANEELMIALKTIELI